MIERLRAVNTLRSAAYTHGTFDKALEAQRKYMEQLLAKKTASEARLASGCDFDGKKQQPLVSGCAASRC